jgi:hypothetical protein
MTSVTYGMRKPLTVHYNNISLEKYFGGQIIPFYAGSLGRAVE